MLAGGGMGAGVGAGAGGGGWEALSLLEQADRASPARAIAQIRCINFRCLFMFGF